MEKLLEKIGLISLVAIIVLFAGILVLEVSSLNKVVYGVEIGDYDVGGFEKYELESLLQDYKLNNKKIMLSADKLTWSAKFEELGISVDVEDTINKAFSIGREKNILAGIKTQIESLLNKKDLKATVLISKNTFDAYIEKEVSDINSYTQNAKFSYDNKTIEIENEKLGNVVDTETFGFKITRMVSELKNEKVEIPFKIDYPQISTKDLISKKGKIEYIIKSAPYIISEDDSQKWELDRELMQELVKVKKINSEVTVVLDKDKLENFLIQLSPSINRDPKDAILTIKNKKATEFILSEDGVKLEVKKSAKHIEDEILSGTGAITLKTNKIPAEIRTDTIENLGIVALLGKGESDFSGSIASRVHNIKLGAEKMNGTLIKPGEEFSFVEILGNISPKEGYEAAYVIKKGVTVSEYGGGLCQVSTTTFRAAMYAGLKITERFPHSYPVSYYKPQGFDAAIYGPHPDLRFLNDTENHILIQSKVVGNKLYFEIYGTPDGRKVVMTGPEIYSQKPDGSLKTWLKREITRDGEVLSERTFWSSYKSKNLYPIQRNPLE